MVSFSAAIVLTAFVITRRKDRALELEMYIFIGTGIIDLVIVSIIMSNI